MGKCEPRDFYLHAVFRDSQKPWGAYIKGLLGSSPLSLHISLSIIKLSLRIICNNQVRSTTLDTWLPDQVSFMQCKKLHILFLALLMKIIIELVMTRFKRFFYYKLGLWSWLNPLTSNFELLTRITTLDLHFICSYG